MNNELKPYTDDIIYTASIEETRYYKSIGLKVICVNIPPKHSVSMMDYENGAGLIYIQGLTHE